MGEPNDAPRRHEMERVTSRLRSDIPASNTGALEERREVPERALRRNAGCRRVTLEVALLAESGTAVRFLE